MRTSILIETSLRYAITASNALKDCNIEKVFDCEIYYKSGSEFVIYMNDDSVDDELCDTIRELFLCAGVTEYELF
jgi:hypothetical protein